MVVSVVILYMNSHDVNEWAKYFQFIFNKREKKRADPVCKIKMKISSGYVKPEFQKLSNYMLLL